MKITYSCNFNMKTGHIFEDFKIYKESNTEKYIFGFANHLILNEK